MIFLMSGSIFAKSRCSDIQGKQGFHPLILTNGIVCFVQEPVLNSNTGVPIGEDAISLYYISNGNAPVKAMGRGLLYDESPGKIVDSFPLATDQDNNRIAVIHSVDVRQSLVEENSSGQFYSVSVFVIADNNLRRDERASDWFGADYSWISNNRRVTYVFPYQTKKDVRRAVDSSFASLMNGDKIISAKVKNKSYLFDLPSIKDETKKYLIAGDKVTVDKATAGWCQISYNGGKKAVQMWLLCSALAVDARSN
ncbi:hypothetical protein [Paraburkholderia sp. J10-1]|uniref:hypothetical protein n=1 Tax=Paraburkholderia sp. J10-1 TaxID=2805430 RepID=UPI002AB71BBE|nr:hypothetical protein [Paraburkholderia sp. J10-1]